MSEESKSGWGGVRPGGGRPKGSKDRAPRKNQGAGKPPGRKFNFFLPGELVRVLERISALTGIAPGRWIRDTVRNALFMASMSLPDEEQPDLPGLDEDEPPPEDR